MDTVLQKPRHETEMMKRPIGVTALVFVMIAAGAVFAAAGVNFFLMSTGAHARGVSAALAGLGAAAGVIFLLFGLLHIIFAIGLMQLRDAARILTILLFGLSFIGAVIGGVITMARLNLLALGWDILVLMADLFVIRYLSNSHVKQHFEGQPFRTGKSLRAS